jgi:glycerol dehydrogenase
MRGMLQQLRVAGFPGRYLQGPGALEALPDVARELGGSRLLLVSDDVVQQALGQRLEAQLLGSPLACVRLRFGGECTRSAIEDLTRHAQAANGDLVVALGGGKTIDTGKGIAKALGAPLIVAPTIASNDSATSRLIVLYDDEHRLLDVELMARNPDAVLVDTAEIARAPVRYFRAGMGDALSKAFEAAQCARAGGINFHGGRPPRTARLLGDHCYAVLQELGAAAVADVARGSTTEAVEDVIEATVLLSGLAFESGGLSIAHALLRGLSTVPALDRSLHGEMVSFGTLVQVVLEQRPAAWIERHLELMQRLGLPATLTALGKEALSAEELATVVARTLAAPYIGNFDRPLDAATLSRAVIEADTLGRSIRP